MGRDRRFQPTQLRSSRVPEVWRKKPLNSVLKNPFLGGWGKFLDARLANSRGMRRTYLYAAVRRDEQNAADGRFSIAF